jgi:hypothetical protein
MQGNGQGMRDSCPNRCEDAWASVTRQDPITFEDVSRLMDALTGPAPDDDLLPAGYGMGC